MKRDRVAKVKVEIERVVAAMAAMDKSGEAYSEGFYGIYHNSPKETGALRRASLDLTRALAEMRKGDYNN